MRPGVGHSPGRRQLLWGLTLIAVAGATRLQRAFGAAGRVASSQGPLRFFTVDEAEQLDSLGDSLVPGSRSAGLSRFIDKYVSVAPANSLLTLRYLDIAPPYGEFYRKSLRLLGTYRDVDEALRRLSETEPLFYFALRSDAIDVTYGTMAGFGMLGVPYLPHIAPRVPW